MRIITQLFIILIGNVETRQILQSDPWPPWQSWYKSKTEVFQEKLMGFTQLFQFLCSAQVHRQHFALKKENFSICIFPIICSAESAGSDSAEGCSTLQNSRTSHG